MAILQLIMGNLLFWLWVKHNKQKIHVCVSSVNYEVSNLHKRNIIRLFITLLFLIGIIFVMEAATHWPMMFLVSLISILYPITWCLLKVKIKEFYLHFKNYQESTSNSLNNEVVLFLSSGLFGRAFSGTSFADGIQSIFYNIANVSFLLFSVIIMLTIFIFTILGVHQLVVVTILLTQIIPINVGTTPEVLALLIMISWSMSAILSPINPLNLLVSRSVKKPGISVGLKWNGVYLLSVCIVGILLVYLIH